jgi:hypothetical protein
VPYVLPNWKFPKSLFQLQVIELWFLQIRSLHKYSQLNQSYSANIKNRGSSVIFDMNVSMYDEFGDKLRMKNFDRQWSYC